MSLLITLVLSAFCLLLTYLIGSLKRPRNYPPGPKWWPFVGNSYQLRALAKKVGGQYMAFEELSKKYNSDVIGMKLGNEYVVVVQSYKLVKHVHTTEEFEGRPNNFFIRLRTMGTRLGVTCTDGPMWAEHRNFTTRHLRQVGYGKTPMELHIQKEAQDLLDVITEFNEKPIWPGSFLSLNVINVIWTLTAGQRIERSDKRLVNLLSLLQKRSKIFDLCGGSLSQFPWLRFIAPEKSGYNLIKNVNSELKNFFMETIREHKETYAADKKNIDLIYAFLKEMEDRTGMKNNTFTDDQLTMTILDMFLAGSYTTSTTLDLVFMMMVVRPDVQEKVHKEIMDQIQNNTASISDKAKMPYTEAVLMEVQRYFTVAPLGGPRRVMKDTNLEGYVIPKNTTVLMSLRSVLKDKDHWGDPDIFRPERFLDNNGTIINDEYFIAFGLGRRRCLGESLAKSCLFMLFVSVLQNFKLKLPESADIPDTNTLPGLVVSAKPYKIVFSLH